MSASPLAPSALIDALRVETAGYRALVTVLEAEREALRRADGDALSALTAAKIDHVSALSGLASARDALLRDAGYAHIDVALMALAAAPDGELIRREWASLTDVARTARTLNAINGRLIASQQRHFDTALAALMQAAGVQPVYGADGRPQRGSTTRLQAAA